MRMLTATLISTILAVPSFATNYYVLPGGSGIFAGTSWTNAACRFNQLPGLTPGDVIYVGNVAGKNMADTSAAPCAGDDTHMFSASGTASSPITIKAATTTQHGSDTGWNNSYGVDVNPRITWANTFGPGDGLKLPFIDVCASNIVIDGVVGNGNESAGTYGFYFRSAGRMYGFIRSLASACSSSPSFSLAGLKISHVEFDGVNANVTEGGAHAGASGFQAGSSIATQSASNYAVDHFYIHDIAVPMLINGLQFGLTVSIGTIANNWSDASQHSNGINNGAPSQSVIGLKDFDLHNVVFKNIVGTGMIVCLTGLCDGWKIYNNLFYYTADWSSICSARPSNAACVTSKLVGDNGSSGNSSSLTNMVLYGNTFYNLYDPRGTNQGKFGPVITFANSTGNVAKNNLWVKCENAPIGDDGTFIGVRISHDYNTWVNSSFIAHQTGLNSHEVQLGTYQNQVVVDPFVGSMQNDFRLAKENIGSSRAPGSPLPAPFNLDANGTPRGLDGFWDRGAFEFQSPTRPNPPTGLTDNR